MFILNYLELIFKSVLQALPAHLEDNSHQSVCAKYGSALRCWMKHSERLTLPTSSHWLTLHYEPRLQAGMYTMRTGILGTYFPDDENRDGS